MNLDFPPGKKNLAQSVWSFYAVLLLVILFGLMVVVLNDYLSMKSTLLPIVFVGLLQSSTVFLYVGARLRLWIVFSIGLMHLLLFVCVLRILFGPEVVRWIAC